MKVGTERETRPFLPSSSAMLGLQWAVATPHWRACRAAFDGNGLATAAVLYHVTLTLVHS